MSTILACFYIYTWTRESYYLRNIENHYTSDQIFYTWSYWLSDISCSCTNYGWVCFWSYSWMMDIGYYYCTCYGCYFIYILLIVYFLNYTSSITTISLRVPTRCGGHQVPTQHVVMAVWLFFSTFPCTYFP